MLTGQLLDDGNQAKDAAARYLRQRHGATRSCHPLALLLRHGGASTHRWRVVKALSGRERGDAAFNQARGAMRQGGVALWIAGEIVRIATAPRLRSRW